jgi:hypothetical protein
MVNFMRYGITRTAVVATLGLAVLAAGGIITTFVKPSLWTDIQFNGDAQPAATRGGGGSTHGCSGRG